MPSPLDEILIVHIIYSPWCDLPRRIVGSPEGGSASAAWNDSNIQLQEYQVRVGEETVGTISASALSVITKLMAPSCQARSLKPSL